MWPRRPTGLCARNSCAFVHPSSRTSLGTTGAVRRDMWNVRALVTVLVVAWSSLVSAAPATSPVASDVSDEPLDREVTQSEPRSQRALVLSAAGTAGVYLALYGWVTLAWYVRTTDSDSLNFHDEGWFGRDTYAGGADKLGHAWGTYVVTRGTSQLLQAGGWSRRGSILAGGGLSLAFFTFAEIKDGYKEEYGFSVGDEIFDVIGAVGGVLLELYPDLDRRLDFRISYFPSSAYIARLETDGPFNSPEDYSGQTMLLAYHLGSIEALVERASWTRYLDVSVGYQTRGYRPLIDGSERSQELFVGASLNLQGVLDRVVRRPGAAGVVHFITEMYQVPYTTLRIGELQRTSPPVMTTP